MTKYSSDDGKTELEAEDDAATAIWGAIWQTPLQNQFGELIDTCYTTTEWTTLNDINGYLITSKQNGKSIFLPAAGTHSSTNLNYAGTGGYYWSRSRAIREFYAHCLHFTSSSLSVSNYGRFWGLTIRPIRVPLKPYNWPVHSIRLDKTQIELGRNTTDNLKATVLPTYAMNTSVAWESSDESIAVVNESGLVRATGVGTCSIICRSTDGTDVSAECQVTVLSQGETNGHEWVDLDLPSGTLWATTNVGADTPTDFGNYFAWGEVTSDRKSSYSSWSLYKWVKSGESTYQYINKYTIPDGETDCSWYKNGVFVGDGRTWLQFTDDAAYRYWGNKWQMPSKEQCEELINSTYNIVEWETQENGIKGLRITSRTNGNSIFVPAAGFRERYDDAYTNQYGLYWTRSLSEQYSKWAYQFAFSWSITVTDIWRFYGKTVRPVRNQEFTYVNKIVLDNYQLLLEPNQQVQLNATITPENADNPSLKWISSNPAVASVSQDGIVTAGTNGGACTIVCLGADGNGAKTSCKVCVLGEICPDNNHPHAIDLGLPSGTKWCCSDAVGFGYTPFEYDSGFYAWGEIATKDEYDDDTWRLYNSSTHEYADMGEGLVGTNYDLARLIMGAPWQMPTYEQAEELVDNCTSIYTDIDVGQRTYSGVIVTGPNNKQIFLCANGYKWIRWNDDKGRVGAFWTATAYPDNKGKAYALWFNEDGTLTTSAWSGCRGLSIRAVQP